jgi:hypothetical protein
MNIQEQMSRWLMPLFLLALIVCLTSSSLNMDSENSVLFLHQIVTAVVWFFGAASIIVAILIFAQREKEILKLVIAELICTIVVETCLLIFPFLDSRLDHFREDDFRQVKSQLKTATSDLTSAHTEIGGLSNQVQRVVTEYNEATNALALAQATAIGAANALTNANIAVLQNLNRHLSNAQQNELLRVIDPLPKEKISFFVPQDVPDGKVLANDIYQVFMYDKWERGKMGGGLFAGLGEGVFVKGNESDGTTIKAIADELSALGLNAIAQTNPATSNPRIALQFSNVVEITIGFKPQQ